MVQFFIDGGPPNILVLVFGTILIVFSALYALRPARNKLRFVRGLNNAITWIMVGGFAAGMRLTLSAVAQLPAELEPQKADILMKGVSECLAVVILGTGFLTLAWFIIAIGLRRQEA